MKKWNELYLDFPFSLPMLLDGATGTAMIRAGMPSGVCPERWILSHPDAILHTQSAYRACGSDAVLTPTFGANRAVLRRYGLEAETEEMNRALAALSREAVGENGLIGGDLSPSGKFLAPVGTATFDELIDDYRDQVRALAPLVDFFVVETFMDLAAARAAVLAVKEASDKPIFVTLTVTPSGKTMSGDDPAAALLTLSALGISAFGLNCSTGPSEMLSFLAPLVPLSRALRIPLIAKPNAGPPDANGTRAPLSPEQFGKIGAAMLQAGIAVLGGCCGTDETHVRALREAIDAFDAPSDPAMIPSVARLACTGRVIAEIPTDLPDPIDVGDDFADDASDMADNLGFAFVRLRDANDARTVLDAAPYCPFPLAVRGDEDAIALLRREYCGKIVSA